MLPTTKFKQKITLFLFCLSCAVSFVATGVVISLFFKKEEQDGKLVSVSLVVEPNLLDFQEVDAGEHEGIVYLVNQSNRKIAPLFTKSSCSCSVLELPKDLIAPGEKVVVKCTLSTVDRSGPVGGVILVAYRFSDTDEETASPMYVAIKLKAIVRVCPCPPVSLSTGCPEPEK